MVRITHSASFHHLYPEYLSTNVSKIFQEWNKCIPYIRPWYAVSPASSPDLVSILRNQQIQMICHNAREVKLVNDAGLVVVDGKRVGDHERIIRNGASASASAIRMSSSVPIWVHTKISNEGIDHTRKMFEYIWANKYILNGIVFDISNFTHPTQSIPPSMYSYKVAMDYIFRNIVYPFEKEYGISTPAIMIDGRNHICRLGHLYDLHEQGLSHCKHLWEKQPYPYPYPCLQASRPKLHLIVGSLFDTNQL
jgi:hypothetical protein